MVTDLFLHLMHDEEMAEKENDPDLIDFVEPKKKKRRFAKLTSSVELELKGMFLIIQKKPLLKE